MRVCPELCAGIFVRQIDDSQFYYNPTFLDLPARALLNLRVPTHEVYKSEEKCYKIKSDWEQEAANLSDSDELEKAKQKYEKDIAEASKEHSAIVAREQERLATEEEASKFRGSGLNSNTTSNNKIKVITSPKSEPEPKKKKSGKAADDEDEAMKDDAEEIEDELEGKEAENELESTVLNHNKYQKVSALRVPERLIAHIFATKSMDPTISELTMEIAELDSYGRRLVDVNDNNKNEEQEADGNTDEEKEKSKRRGHTETGIFVAIHSVVVDAEFQGQGLGSTLMTDYIQRMETVQAVPSVQSGPSRKGALILLADEKHVPFYSRLGFTDDGVSECKFGNTVWHDMSKPLESGWN